MSCLAQAFNEESQAMLPLLLDVRSVLMLLIRLHQCCPSLMTRDHGARHEFERRMRAAVQWFRAAGFEDVQIKRIGPKWYRGVRRHGLIMGCSVTGKKSQVN